MDHSCITCGLAFTFQQLLSIEHTEEVSAGAPPVPPQIKLELFVKGKHVAPTIWSTSDLKPLMQMTHLGLHTSNSDDINHSGIADTKLSQQT